MGDSRGILPHSVMYGAIQMLVGYERFGKILHEDCVFMDAVRGFDAPIRQRISIFIRRNTRKYLQKPLIRSLKTAYIGDILNFRTDIMYPDSPQNHILFQLESPPIWEISLSLLGNIHSRVL